MISFFSLSDAHNLFKTLCIIIVNYPYNAHSDWLKHVFANPIEEANPLPPPLTEMLAQLYCLLHFFQSIKVTVR